MKKAIIAFAALWLLLAANTAQKAFGGAITFGVWSFFLACAISVSAYSFGRMALVRIGLDFENNGTLACAAAFTLGLAALAYSMFLLGVLKLFYPAAAALLLGAFLWSGRNYLTPPPLGLPEDKSGLLPAAPLLLLGALLWFCATVPPHQYDSLVYHLALPQAYALNHGIVPLPQNMYSHFPQNGELLFTLALLLKSDIAAQFVSLAATLGSCLWILAYARTANAPGLLAVLLALSHTALLLLSVTTYIEPLACLWTTAAVLSFMKWKDCEIQSQALLWLLLCGIFCGAALGTKYYSGLLAAIIFFMALSHTFTVGTFSLRKIRFLQVFAFAAVCFALYLPWGIKNIAEIGNPFYPFFYKIFRLPDGTASLEAKRYFLLLTEYKHATGAIALKGLFQFPFRLFQDAGQFGCGMDVLGSIGWEMVFAGAPLILYAASRKRQSRWLAVFLLVYWVLWFLTGKVLRFLVVIIPLSALATADGAALLWRECGKPLRAALAAGFAIFIAARIFSFVYVENMFGAPQAALGIAPRPEYLSRKLNYYPCASAANALLPADAKVLVAGEHRSYYLERNNIPTSIVRDNEYVAWANSGNPRQGAQKAGITHIIYLPEEERRLHYYGTLQYTDAGRAAWKEFLLSLKPLYADGHCALYSCQGK